MKNMYLYTGHINVDDKTGTELLDIMIASDELKLEQLTKLAEDFILENHHQFCEVNPIILKRDDLNLPEIEVWENLIKWGLAQGQTPNQHVKSYEEILPKELRDDILKFHMVTEYKPTLDKSSQRCPKYSLINQNHIIVFSNWIDKKGKITKYTSKTIPYELNLLYRASRDGGTPEAFHKKCDNKGATIIIIKIKDSEKIIGGYNPFDWDSSYSNGTKSIGCYPDYGPVFGNLKTDDYEVFPNCKEKSNKKYFKKKTEIQKNDPDLDDEEIEGADKISEEDREREERNLLLLYLYLKKQIS
ncbi:unnamed protein product [Rhizophagus irregularis]|nr:unnamed protein product [Rhizophagus irregularis]